jgi:hypothetical protein
MRYFMVQGDVVANAKGEKPTCLEPVAIFCFSGDAHHDTWVRLTAADIRLRLAGAIIDRNNIPTEEFQRALIGIDQHILWQRDVLQARGSWVRLKNARKTASKEASDEKSDRIRPGASGV